MVNIPFLTKKRERDSERLFEAEATTAADIIAPASVQVNSEYIDMSGRMAKSFFVFSYPRYLSAAWLSSAINLDVPMEISMFVHPVDTSFILKQLRRRVTEVQSELMEHQQRGLVRDPELETAFEDLEGLRDRLQTAQEKMFRFGLYITVYGETQEELRSIETTLRSIFESRLIYIKPALYQQKEGFNSCLPYGRDILQVHTSLNTEPLSSTFPFVSFDLSSNEGILYGVNRHNNSLILFDRFTLENANEVIFAKSGSGKSYAVKLDILRSLMTGVDVV
ncbi:MAG: conjugal transfer protein TraC, partial [bacterium]|nr:conjugal transfer protein TraC [bacterium]